jgi:hypothetical protein
MTNRQLAPGCFPWRTGSGRYLTADQTGTHRIPPSLGDWLLAA